MKNTLNFDKYYKTTDDNKSFRKALIIAALCHVILFIFLFTQIKFSSPQPVIKSGHDVVNAVAINQTQVNDEVNKIKQQEIQKKNAEKEHLQKIQKMAEEAKKQKILAAQQMKKLQEQQKLAQQKLEDMQKKAELAAAKTKLEEQKAQQAKQKQVAAQKAAQKTALAHKQKIKQEDDLSKEVQQDEKQDVVAAKQKNDDDTDMQKQLDSEQNQLNQAKNQYMQGVVDKYKALILMAIEQKWLIPNGVDKELTCELAIQLAPGGSVLSVSVSRSSGNDALDRSAVTAVYKASPLPVPADKNEFDYFRAINLTVKPENVLNG